MVRWTASGLSFIRERCLGSPAVGDFAWMVAVTGVLNLKGVVLAGLKQAQKLVLASGDDGGIDQQFRIMTPEGDFLIAMTLSGDPGERGIQLQLISALMAWKRASVFTVAGQLTDPDAVFSSGATHQDQIAAISAIERDPIRFGNPEWLALDVIAEETLALLAHGEAALKAVDLANLEVCFGSQGRFPALRLGDGIQFCRP
jgi:hypothetical protein